MLAYAGGTDGFVRETLTPVREALAEDAGVLVAVEDGRARALVQALEDDRERERVRSVPMHELGRNPSRMLALWQQFAREHAADGHGKALGIGEPVWPGRSAAELGECERHEALVNLAFDRGPGWRLLCVYDLEGLGQNVIDGARASHPWLCSGGSSATNDGYAGAQDPPQPFAGSLPDPQAAVERLAFAGETLGQMRHALSAWARAQGMSVDGAEALVLAVNELAVNSVRHGGGAGTLLRWRENGELLCEVRDTGHIREPLTGRVRPAADACSGRGLWLANQLCDLVQIRSAPAGSAVRVHKRLP